MTRGRGVLDLALVAVATGVLLGRTVIGGGLWYGVQRARGETVPSLTAFFSSGMVAPDLEQIAPPGPAPRPDQLPEPWRTAAATALHRRVPASLGTAEAAMGAVDAAYASVRDPQQALEVAVLGELRARAVGRARAVAERDPEAYASYRRYLPSAVLFEADPFLGQTAALATVLDLRWPVDGEHPLTSGFGERADPFHGRAAQHEGVDVSMPVGTPVRAAQGGVVAAVGHSATNGTFVTLDHGSGVLTAYLHLSVVGVAQGATVVRGDPIATSGRSGRATGPHLHFALQIAGRWVDPERFR